MSLEGLAVASVFLHVISAVLAAILWAVGLVMLFTMIKRGYNSHLLKLTIYTFIVSGIFFVLMEVFGSLAYSVYDIKVEEVLSNTMPFLAFIFNLKLLLTALATFTGLLTVGIVLTYRTYREAYFSMTLALVTLILFGVCAILAVLVMTSVSI